MTKIELVLKELDDLRQFYLQINYRNKISVTHFCDERNGNAW
jgi:hypothetical protein